MKKSARTMAHSHRQQNSSDDDEDSDWDSEPELEVARVQEAARLSRRVPSIRNSSKSAATATGHQQHAPSKNNGGGSSSPFYCQEIGPQLDLGYQWPQRPLHETRGFVKVSASNTSSRQRQVDRMLLARRQKVRQSAMEKQNKTLNRAPCSNTETRCFR